MTFSVVDAVVLRPLPFDQPDELVAVERNRGDRAMSQVRAMSAVQFLALRERTDAFAVLAAVTRGWLMIETGAEPERVTSARVTATLFEVLGVRPLLGRTFSAAHETAGSDFVALLAALVPARRASHVDPLIVLRAE